jgi:hypothetical protein
MLESEPDGPSRIDAAILALVLAAAVVVRLCAEEVAWTGYTLDYLSMATSLDPYTDPKTTAWTAQIGLHPVQYGLFLRGLVSLGMSVGGLIALFIGLSITAVAVGTRLLQRRGLSVAAGVFGGIAALSPLQAYYSWQPSNYGLITPVGFAWVALLLGSDRPTPKAQRWLWLVIPAVLLHLHLLGMALVGLGLILLVWRRRTAEVVATSLALILASPVVWSLLVRLWAYRDSAEATAHVSPGFDGTAGLLRAYLGHFGDPLMLGGLVLATTTAIVVLLFSRARGDRAVLVALCVTAGLPLAAILGGVANPRQGQYWLLPALVHAGVIALAAQRTSRWPRAALAVLLTPWLLGSMAQASGTFVRFVPEFEVEPVSRSKTVDIDGFRFLHMPDLPHDLSEGATRLDPEETKRVRAALVRTAESVDTILYVAEPWWPSDDPRRSDPFFGAFRPFELKPMLPPPRPVGAPPRDGFPFPWRWRGRRLQDAVSVPRPVPVGDPHAFRESLEKELAAGRDVLVAFAVLDPSRGSPRFAVMMEGFGPLKQEKVGPVTLITVRARPTERSTR